MTDQPAGESTKDDMALVKITKVLMDAAMKTQDERITRLAMQARDFVKEGDAIDALLMMLPDEDDEQGYQSPYVQPQAPPKRRRR